MATSKYEDWDQAKLTEFADVPVEISLETIFDRNAIALRKVVNGELHLMILTPKDIDAIISAAGRTSEHPSLGLFRGDIAAGLTGQYLDYKKALVLSAFETFEAAVEWFDAQGCALDDHGTDFYTVRKR